MAGAPEAGAGPSADSLFRTRESLVDMGEMQQVKLEELIYQVLVLAHEMLSTGASFNGVLCGFPVFNAPPAAEQAVEGYEGGVFRPEHRAAGYAVVKRKGVGGVIQTSNHDAPWTLNPQSSPVSETSQPLMRKVPCGYKKRGNNPKPDMGPYTPYKYYLVESGFLASTPADTKQELEVYFVFNEPQRKAKTTRAAVPPTTKVDIVPPTLTDAPVDLGAASEITPDEFSEQVTGLVERLSLTEAATISDAPRPLVGAGQGAAGALGGALALKTEGNEHFRVGHYLPALALYSDAIEMLEGADEDATLGTILCNRSVAYLDARLPAAALVDAERARALGVGKAHFRLAEALSQLGCWKEALEAYAAALGNAQEGKNKLDVRGKIEELTRFNSKRVEVRATPADFAQKLLRAVPGTTLLLAPGRYMGPFDISFEVWIVGGGQPGDVVLDSTDGGKATLTVRCAGRVGLQSLDVRRTAGKDPALNQHALWVLSGAVTADKCTFTSKGGACVSVTNSGSSLVLRGGGASQGVAAGVIVSNSARVHAIKATVSDNEAAGFEVREKGELVLDNCDLCNNIRQGLMLWCLGTSARATRCRVNGHQHESAVTCQTGELTMTQCTVYNNGRWGITVDGGRAVVKRCTVRKQKLDGILVQESGSALLEDTTIHHNNGKGIFIGFDVHHPVTVRNNTIHHNAQEGIKNGVPGCAKVFIDGNKEWDNMRKMADRELAKLFCETMDQAIAESTKEGDKGMTQTAKQEKKAQHLEVRNRRWGTNVVKTGAAEKIHNERRELLRTHQPAFKDSQTKLEKLMPLQGLACFECGKAAPDEKTPLIPCGKCRVAVYCSVKCQTADWDKEGGHKGKCKKNVEFPSVGHGRDVRPDPSLGTLGGDSQEVPQPQVSPPEEHFKLEGNQHFAAKEYVKAVAAYTKAVKADPENGVLYSNRAAAFIHLGKESRAIKDAETAIKLKPDWAKGYYRKGAALSELRRWDAAEDVLTTALEIEPQSKEITLLLRDVIQKRDDASGEEKLEKEVAYAERQLHRDAEKGRRLLQKNRSALLPAVVEGDLTKVRQLIAAKANLNMQNEEGKTPLHYAALNGHPGIVGRLLEANAAPDKIAMMGTTPLLTASKHGHEAVVEKLLAARTNKENKSLGGKTPLVWAAGEGHEGVVEKLLAAGANKNAADMEGRTAMHEASMGGHEGVVQKLLAVGTDKDATDDRGDTPLHLAAHYGSVGVVEQLLAAGADQEAKDEEGHTPLQVAMEANQEEAAKMLRTAGAL